MTVIAIPRPPEIDHEMVTLGCGIGDTACRAVVAAELTENDFSRPAHQLLYKVLAGMHTTGAAGGLAAFRAEVETREAPDGRPLAEVTGGPGYLFSLWQQAVSAAQLPYHIGKIREAADRRAVGEEATRLAQAAADPHTDITRATVQAVVELERLTLGTTRWPDPIPLGQPALPALPAERLPGVWGEVTRAVAASTQTRPDLAALCALGVLSAATRGMWRLGVTGDWSESLALYTAGLAESGERKTAVLDLLAAPFLAREMESIWGGRRQLAEEAAAYQVAKARAERAARDAAQATGDRSGGLDAEARALAAALAEMDEPTATQWWVDDASPEALGAVMAANEEASAHFADEGVMFSMLAGRYSGSPNLDLFLRAYDGSRPVRVNRVSRPPVFLEQPFLAVAVLVQPDVVAQAAAVPEMRERGMLPRFLFAYPASNLGRRALYAPAVSGGVRDGWDGAVRRILDASVAIAGGRRGEQGRAVLALDRRAAALFDAWRDAHERRLDSGHGDLADITAWASKLPGKVSRVAGNLTLADDPVRVWVGEVEVQAGVDLADYWVAHARAALALRRPEGTAASSGPEPAEVVLRWLLAQRVPVVTVRDVWQAMKRRLWAKSTAEVRAVLGVLEEHGWVRVEEGQHRPGRGRQSSPVVTVNPKAWRLAEGGGR